MRFKNIITKLKFILNTYHLIYNDYLLSENNKDLSNILVDESISKNSKINTVLHIKETVVLDGKNNLYPNVTFYGNNHILNTEIGEYSYLALNTIVHNSVIGRYCSIGPNCVIGYGDHITDKCSTSPIVYLNHDTLSEDEINERLLMLKKKVEIKNDVWVGANVFIKNGVTIGNGAIIGAGAVVLQDVPDYSVVVGVPAKIKKFRFTKEVINEFLHIKWWNYEPSQLKNFKDLEY